jgi:hypothetical protein
MTKLKLATLAGILGLALGGCSTAPPVEDQTEAAAHPKLVTDLSGSTSPASASMPGDLNAATIALAPSDSHDSAHAGPRVFLDNPTSVRRVGTDAEPAETTLSNAKAAKFGSFSNALLNQVFAQVRLLLHTDQMERTKVPDDIDAVLITATIDREGKLQELVLEQHAGRAAVDKMFLEACKRGLWYHNPPPAAQADGGGYIVHIKGKITNYASPDGKIFRFHTLLALGLS